MKKSILKSIIITLLIIVLTFTLSGCKKKISEKYADKIQDSIDNNDPMTYQEIVKTLGESSNDTLANFNTSSGYVLWFSNHMTSEEATKKVEDGKEVYYLFVYFEDYKATKVIYKKYNLYDSLSTK